MKNYQKIVVLCAFVIGQTALLATKPIVHPKSVTAPAVPSASKPGSWMASWFSAAEYNPFGDFNAFFSPAMRGAEAPALPAGQMKLSDMTKDPIDEKVPVTAFGAYFDGLTKARLQQIDRMIGKYVICGFGAAVIGCALYAVYKHVMYKRTVPEGISFIKKQAADVIQVDASRSLSDHAIAQIIGLGGIIASGTSGVFCVSNVAKDSQALIGMLSIERDIACIPGKLVAGCFGNPQLHKKLTKILQWLEVRKVPLVVLDVENLEMDKTFSDWLAIAFPRNVVVLSFAGNSSGSIQGLTRCFDLHPALNS